MTFFILLFSFVSNFSWGQAGAINPTPNNDLQNQLLQSYIQQQTGQNKGCMQTMVEQVSDGLTSKFEQQQQAANSLMGISQQFFEQGRQCRNDLGSSMLKYEQAKLDYQLEQNKLNVQMKRQEIAYKKAVLAVKRDCDATANEQFQQFKAGAGNGVVGAKQGGPQALFGRNRKVNKFRKLFYDDCMADPLNIEAMRITGLEMAANIEEIQANLKSASDSMASVTKQLEFAQDQTLRNCAEGEEQLRYQEAVIRNTNAQAQAMVQKQNVFGILGAGMTCVFGPNSVVPGFANDGTGNRFPASSGNSSFMGM